MSYGWWSKHGCLDYFVKEEMSNLSNISTLHLRPFYFPLVSEYGEYRVSHDHREPEAPDQGYGIEKVGISRPRVYPKVVEGGAEKSGVENCSHREEVVAHH